MRTRLFSALVIASLIVLPGNFVVNARADNGTALFAYVSNSNSAPACSNQPVAVDVTVYSTASASPVFLFTSVNGGDFTPAGVSNNWSSDGRTRTLQQTIGVQIPAVGANVWVLAIQPGANGNDNKQTVAFLRINPSCGQGDGSQFV
jgi:hypothetical protein